MRVSCAAAMQQQSRERVECAARLLGHLRVGQRGDDVERGELRGVDEHQQRSSQSSRSALPCALSAGMPSSLVRRWRAVPSRVSASAAMPRQRGRSRDRAARAPSACRASARGPGASSRIDVLRGELRDARCACSMKSARQGRRRRREFLGHDGREAGFDLRHQRFAGQLRQVRQPFGAPRQHAGDQLLEPQPAVVEAPQDELEILAQFRIGFRVAQGFARRDRVQIVGRIGDAAPETVLRGDGQRVGEIAVEGIDGLDAQARRAVFDAPAARAPRARAPRPRARASAHRRASGPRISPSSAFCTRSRISPAALRVKVIASTCSGSSTVVSSRR